jgi:hypothetical protein
VCCQEQSCRNVVPGQGAMTANGRTHPLIAMDECRQSTANAPSVFLQVIRPHDWLGVISHHRISTQIHWLSLSHGNDIGNRRQVKAMIEGGK